MAISGPEPYFQSEEKNDVLARVAQHQSRKLNNIHLRRYEYMVSFDKLVHEMLSTLARC